MKKKNKFVAMLLAVMMLMGLFTAAPFSVAAYTYHSQAEAISWVQSQNGRAIDYDGSYGAQCVDLILAYYNYLVGYTVSGNAVDYTWNSLPNGWYRTSSPSAGDIVVWGAGSYMGKSGYYADGTYGHIGVVTAVNGGSMDYYDQNGYPQGQVVGAHYGHATSSAATFIHPDFTGDAKTGIDYGNDFYALIINTPCWKPIGQADNGNVELMTEKRENYIRTIWCFQKVNSRNEYKITSIYNGYSLDVYGASSADGANVECYPYHGGSAQQWFIQEKDGNTVLTASCTDKCLDLAWGSSTDGANIQMVVSNGTDAQKWTIWKFTDRDYYPELTVDKTEICVGEQATVKVITDAPYVYQYVFSVYENDILQKTVTTPSPEYSFSNTDTGTYTIYATTKNPYHTKAAGSVSVTVKTTAELINADDYSPNKTSENNDTRYEYYDVMVPWSVAKEICEQKGGHLVVIDNQPENDFVNQMTLARIWLGVSDVEEEGEWKTILGYLTPFSKWDEGQPDNAASVEHYAMMRANGTWNDAPIETKMGFVCEYESPAIGDIDLDGKITIRDVTALQRHLADVEILSSRQLAVADVNGNGAINIADATLLQQHVAEFDVTLG